MKKFLASLVVLTISTMIVVGATHKNAEIKYKSQSAVSYAMVGVMGFHGGGTTARKAAIFNKLKKENPRSVITDSMIRMEAVTESGKSDYEFFHRILGGESRTERKLNDQDAFHATELGFYLMQESTTVPGIGILQTYPNPQVFPAEAGFVTNDHLEVFYNSYFLSKVGDTVYIPDLPLMDCRVVNTAQQTALATNDSERRPGDGRIPLLPNLHLKGRENNSLHVIVPAAANQLVASNSGVSGYKIKLVLCLFGYKVTGAGNA